MKHFIYFQDCEGGMNVTNFSDPDGLRYWIPYWDDSDNYLVDFCKTAEIGDHIEHRLGVLVRVRHE